MKILVLSTWFPYPPDNGSRIRAYNLMKALAARHELLLVSLLQEDSNPADAERLADICRVVSLHPSRWFRPGTLASIVGTFSPRPRSYVDTFDPAIERAVRTAIDDLRPDLLLVFEAAAMAYAPARKRVPTILEQLEIGSMAQRPAGATGLARHRLKLTFAKHRNLIRDLLRRADAYTCVSDDELRLITRHARPSIPGTVIPNGVDTERISPSGRRPEPDTLIYNGALTYSANLDAVRHFASDVYPLLERIRPGVELRVTGRTQGVDLTGVSQCPGIELVGYVDDIRDVLATSAACVVPLREGGGTRLKILEAMAAGVPVVTTSVGAEGIDARDGEHLLIADSPGAFAEAVRRVLAEPDLADGLARRARALVEERYSWRGIADQLSSLIENLAREPHTNNS